MTERELLGLAAKAAGYAAEWGDVITMSDGTVIDCTDFLYVDDGIPWDPRNDDGDALRLSVKCGLLHIDELVVHYSDEVFKEGIDGDMNKAVRLAIILAAADIGKGMK